MPDSVIRISAIIPAHNEEKLIFNTLEQLRNALEQVNAEYQIIVVDDDSDDQTANLANAAGAEVIHVKLRNIGAVRNAGAQSAIFEYLVFIDADTLVPAATLQATIEAFQQGAVGGGAMVQLINDGRVIPWHKRWIFPFIATVWLQRGGWAAGCYMFCTAEAFRKFGGFPEEYFAAEEYFFSRSLKQLGPFTILPSPVHTSARKLHEYSLWQLVRFMTRPFFSWRGPLKSRQGLELLYESRRK